MLERITQWLAGDAALGPGQTDLVPSHFGFNAPFSFPVCIALLVLAGLLVIRLYWPRLTGVEGPARGLLVFLRTAVVLLTLFLVLDPSIIAQRVRPGEQFVILLFDDSRSMRIVGPDGLSRGDRLKKAYSAAKETFEGTLKRKHQLARYSLGAGIEPLQDVTDLDFSERESDLIGGVQSALGDLQGTSISAVVLFSDGVQQSPRERLDDLPGTVPIFTVGTDTDAHWRDVEVTSLNVKRTDFDRSPVVVTVGVRTSGLAGRKILVEVRLGSRVAESKIIEPVENLEEHEVRLDFVPDRQGWLEYEARAQLIDSPADDAIRENNARSFIIDNRQKTFRILYVSGRPNWQNRFVRAALDGDKQLKLTSLICISNAERKFVFRGKKSSLANPLFEGFDEERDRPRYDEAVFLRLGAEEGELISGYPQSAEELYTYDLIIWGDVERAFFTTAQMQLTRDFVEKRGGTLLLLGGPNSFTQGEFAGTLLEGMLPAMLYDTGQDPLVLRTAQAFRVVPTMEGSLTGSWSLDSNLEENRRLWESMPPLFGLDRFPLFRVGATVMAEAVIDDSQAEGSPVFVVQRYGEGRCALLAVSDTWQWRMRLGEEDERQADGRASPRQAVGSSAPLHDRLWRQVVRNLVNDVPKPVVLRSPQDTYTQGTPAEFEFVIRDGLFDKRDGLHATAGIITPAQQEPSLDMEESIQETGLYASRFSPEEAGLHTLRLTALTEKGEAVATFEDAFLVEPDHREFRNAQYNPEFLQQLSKPTKRRTGSPSASADLYSLDQLEELAQAIPVPIHRDAETLLLHLWHFPGFFFVLAAMMAAEWYIRRRRGHP